MTRSRSWPVLVMRAKSRWCGDDVTEATPERCASLANAVPLRVPRVRSVVGQSRFPCVPDEAAREDSQVNDVTAEAGALRHLLPQLRRRRLSRSFGAIGLSRAPRCLGISSKALVRTGRYGSFRSGTCPVRTSWP